MTDPPNSERLPEVFQASLSRDQVLQLFDDLSAGAHIRQVMIRTTTDDAPQDNVVSLEHARQQFVNDSIRRIQVRYQFDAQTWCDTLMVNQPHETQLVRTIDQRGGSG